MIRDYQPSDLQGLLDLSELNLEETGPMDAEKVSMFMSASPWFKVIERDGVVVGALILLDETAPYPSPNYQWFCDRYDSFAYVDRVMLAPSSRGQGWGPMLYEQATSWARENGKAILACEVNTIPLNERSLRFHQINGFEEVARANPYSPDAEVMMLVKKL